MDLQEALSRILKVEIPVAIKQADDCILQFETMPIAELAGINLDSDFSVSQVRQGCEELLSPAIANVEVAQAERHSG